jgi:hypothetical protein
MAKRREFGKEKRHIIAARAGYRCSYPDCDKLTVGPGTASETFEDNGYAAHIYAAVPKGPRGQGKLNPVQLSAVSNGIWMCGDHSSLIDKKSGIRFPANMLLGWKALHEYRTSFEQSGFKAAYGFVRELTIDNSALFTPGSEIVFAKTTFLIGPNGSGKTAICEWLTALHTSRNMWRWITHNILNYRVSFDAPLMQTLQVEAGSGALSLSLDNMAVHQNHARVSVIYVRDRGGRALPDDLARLAHLFGMDQIELKALAAMVSSDFVAALSFKRSLGTSGTPTDDLICTFPNGQVESFSQLSGGQQGMIVLELGIEQARIASQFGPTMLLVELKNLGIDWGNFATYLDYFASRQCIFQTVVTSWELPSDVEMLGWQIYRLVGPTGTVLGTIVESARGA